MELGTPDLVILPGTKNTMDDLRWLRGSGMEAVIAKAHAKGSILFGICGGYQMLGQRISDPMMTEGGGTLQGLGYLPAETVFGEEKTLTRVHGCIRPVTGALRELSGCPVDGYEIHMGETQIADDVSTLVQLQDDTNGTKKPDGVACDAVYGSYVHGFFDGEGVVGALTAALARRRGITLRTTNGQSLEAYRERQFDLLAASLREHLDLEYIYRVMGEREMKSWII